MLYWWLRHDRCSAPGVFCEARPRVWAQLSICPPTSSHVINPYKKITSPSSVPPFPSLEFTDSGGILLPPSEPLVFDFRPRNRARGLFFLRNPRFSLVEVSFGFRLNRSFSSFRFPCKEIAIFVEVSGGLL